MSVGWRFEVCSLGLGRHEKHQEMIEKRVTTRGEMFYLPHHATGLLSSPAVKLLVARTVSLAITNSRQSVLYRQSKKEL